MRGEPREHPATGLRYIYVFPVRSDALQDCHAMYARLASRLPWLDVVWEHEYPALRAAAGEKDVFVLWHDIDHGGPRKCRTVYYYQDSVGHPSQMIRHQAAMLHELLFHSRRYDAILVHEPWSADYLRQILPRVGVAASGYDPEILGTPDWDCEKKNDAAFYGYLTGLREGHIPAMEQRLGERLAILNGSYGWERHIRLNRSKAILHVPHSIASFPALRLWQAISSSAALLAPAYSAWPAEAGKHFAPLPWPKEGDPSPFMAAVEESLSGTDLKTMAVRAHEDLSRWTIERCADELAREVAKLL